MSDVRKFNDEKERFKALNSTITFGLLVLYIFVILFNGLTLSTTNTKEVDITVMILSAVFAILNVIIYLKNNYSRKLHKVANYCFIVTYALTFVLSGNEYMQFTIFALLAINILFYNNKDMRVYSFCTFVLNLLYLLRTYVVLKSDVVLYTYVADSMMEVMMKFVVVLCLIYAVYRTSYRGKVFHADIVETLVEHQEYQTALMNKVIMTSTEIQEQTEVSSEMISELEDTTKSVNDKVDSISNSSQITVENIQQQMSMTQTIQTAIEQTVESAKDMVQLATSSNEDIEKSFRILRRLQELSGTIHSANRDVVESLSKLQDNSQEVKSIADLIIGISNQTNLLALNASIESARAGEAGKGFAVVASEIGKLASGTKKAIEQILELSDNLSVNADISSQAVESTIKTTNHQETLIKKVVESYTYIGGNINSLTSDITQIDAMVENLAESNDIIIKNITNISQITEEIVSNSKEVLDISTSNLYAQRIVQEYLQEVKEKSKRLELTKNLI